MAETCPTAEGDSILATDLVEALRSSQKILCDNMVIEGNVDISSIDTVSHTLGITNSDVAGQFIARSVEFEGAVDLSGTTFRKNVDIRGSVFANDVRMPGTTLVEELKASHVRFQGTLDLNRATLHGAASFESATFEGSSLMEIVDFVGQVNFTRAIFVAGASFSRTTFFQRAPFDDATFGSDASFSVAHFQSSASYRSVLGAGKLDFDGAIFAGDLYLDGTQVDSLSMVDAKFLTGSVLAMGEMDIAELDMDVSDTHLIPVSRHQVSVLSLLEDTTRADGQVTKANDAAFERQQLENRDRNPVLKTGIFVVGEQVSGYLVKPLRPLRSMAIVLLVAILSRTIWNSAVEKRRYDIGPRLAGAIDELRGHHLLWTSVTRACSSSVRTVFATKPPNPEGEFPVNVAPKFEWGAQKVLLAIFLISLVNTIPSVKEIIDAIPQY